MLRRLACAAPVLAVLLSLSGCVQRIYEVRMAPRADSDGWDRVLTMTETRTEKDAQGQSLPKQDRRVTPSTFTRDIPSDVGNAGSITIYPTTLGTLTIYAERFRGDTPVADALEARLHAAEEAARLLSGWLKTESANWPGATGLNRWCDVELKSDLRDLAVHLWLTGVDRGGARDPAHSAGWLRVLQFLTERGYLEPGELSQVSRLLMGGAESEATHRWWVRMIARKAGDATVAGGGEAPAFLRSWEASSASLKAYLQRQPEFDALVREVEADTKPGEHAAPVDSGQVLGDQLAKMSSGMVPLFADEAGGWSETLDLELAIPVEPFATNGRWRADTKAVRWFTMLDGPDDKSMYPLNVYAQWVTVDETAQQAIFGSVPLRGVSLARYCLWRTGLTDAEGRAWDQALGGPAPRADVEPALRAAADLSGMPEQLCDQGINLIKDGLGRRDDAGRAVRNHARRRAGRPRTATRLL